MDLYQLLAFGEVAQNDGGFFFFNPVGKRLRFKELPAPHCLYCYKQKTSKQSDISSNPEIVMTIF